MCPEHDPSRTNLERGALLLHSRHRPLQPLGLAVQALLGGSNAPLHSRQLLGAALQTHLLRLQVLRHVGRGRHSK